MKAPTSTLRGGAPEVELIVGHVDADDVEAVRKNARETMRSDTLGR